MIVVVGRQVELGQDVPDVLADRRFRDDEGAGDGGVGAALGHQREHLALARAESFERVAAVQEKALLNSAKLLRPGGTLVYSTCTISRRENEDRIAALLEAAAAGQVPPLELEDLGARAPDYASPHEPRTLQLRPDRDRTTGFFISRLRRPAD